MALRPATVSRLRVDCLPRSVGIYGYGRLIALAQVGHWAGHVGRHVVVYGLSVDYSIPWTLRYRSESSGGANSRRDLLGMQGRTVHADSVTRTSSVAEGCWDCGRCEYSVTLGDELKLQAKLELASTIKPF